MISTATDPAPYSRKGHPMQCRRRFTKLGVVSPVLMTLFSRPVLAGNCLSNAMSGNLSDPDRGECVPGVAPGWWSDAQIATLLPLMAPNVNNPNTNNTKFSDFTAYLGIYSTANGTVKLSDVLDGQAGTSFEVAWTNAYANTLVTPGYIMTTQQLLDLSTGGLALPPGYADLQAFLQSTW